MPAFFEVNVLVQMGFLALHVVQPFLRTYVATIGSGFQ